jgi:hypothetical protein
VWLDGEALRATRREARAGKSCGGAAARSGCPFIGSEAGEAGGPGERNASGGRPSMRRYLGGEARAAPVWEWKRSRHGAPFRFGFQRGRGWSARRSGQEAAAASAVSSWKKTMV